MPASTRRWAQVMSARVSVVEPPRRSSAPPTPARRTYVRMHRLGRRTGTTPAGRRSRGVRPASAGADGCVPRRIRWRARWRTPRGAEPDWNRERTSTTADRSAPGPRLAEDERRPRGRGSGRSSRQTGATLGATGLEHGAPGTGAHPSAEPVLASSVAVVGLEGAFHDDLRTLGATITFRGGLARAASTD